MAFVYPETEPIGRQMCKEGKHHWHMKDARMAKCCRCNVKPIEASKISAAIDGGPHDDEGDV